MRWYELMAAVCVPFTYAIFIQFLGREVGSRPVNYQAVFMATIYGMIAVMVPVGILIHVSQRQDRRIRELEDRVRTLTDAPEIAHTREQP